MGLVECLGKIGDEAIYCEEIEGLGRNFVEVHIGGLEILCCGGLDPSWMLLGKE